AVELHEPLGREHSRLARGGPAGLVQRDQVVERTGCTRAARDFELRARPLTLADQSTRLSPTIRQEPPEIRLEATGKIGNGTAPAREAACSGEYSARAEQRGGFREVEELRAVPGHSRNCPPDRVGACLLLAGAAKHVEVVGACLLELVLAGGQE